MATAEKGPAVGGLIKELLQVMGALMYYSLGGKREILCGVFIANKTGKGDPKEKIRARVSRACKTL